MQVFKYVKKAYWRRWRKANNINLTQNFNMEKS